MATALVKSWPWEKRGLEHFTPTPAKPLKIRGRPSPFLYWPYTVRFQRYVKDMLTRWRVWCCQKAAGKHSTAAAEARRRTSHHTHWYHRRGAGLTGANNCYVFVVLRLSCCAPAADTYRLFYMLEEKHWILKVNISSLWGCSGVGCTFVSHFSGIGITLFLAVNVLFNRLFYDYIQKHVGLGQIQKEQPCKLVPVKDRGDLGQLRKNGHELAQVLTWENDWWLSTLHPLCKIINEDS